MKSNKGYQHFLTKHLEKLFYILIPALGYLIAYFYARGFTDYFKIPIDFISINPTLLIAAILGTTLIIMIFFSYSWLFYKIINSAFKCNKLIKALIGLLFIWLVLMLATKTYLVASLFCLTVLIFALGAYGLISLFKKYPDKHLEVKIIFVIFSVIIIGVFICATAYSTGQALTEKMDKFLVEKDNESIVLLTKYNSTYILANVDRETNTVLNINFSGDDGMQGKDFVLKKIGPLKVTPTNK